MKRLALLAAVMAAAAFIPAATAKTQGDWWSNSLHGNYLAVHEHFFTDYMRLKGNWTVFLPPNCSGTDSTSCAGENTPDVTLHVYYHGREVYSDEILTYGTGDAYIEGTFTERLYWWQLPGFNCRKHTGIGLYSWRVQMDDPFGRAGHQLNVRHTNSIQTFCR